MCVICVQVLQLDLVCNYVCQSVWMCEMCACFIRVLLTTAKIQESQFAYLPTHKITKTALKEIVLLIKINFNLILNFGKIGIFES